MIQNELPPPSYQEHHTKTQTAIQVPLAKELPVLLALHPKSINDSLLPTWGVYMGRPPAHPANNLQYSLHTDDDRELSTYQGTWQGQ